MGRTAHRVTTLSLLSLLAPALLLLAACSDDDPNRPDTGATIADQAVTDPDGSAGKSEMYLNDQYLANMELTLLKGRCLGRLTIDSKDAAARTALEAVGKAVADPIPLDGSAPTTVAELEGLVPAAATLTDWDEDTSDGVDGPWSMTDVFAWINGGGKPFDDNGFEAVAGETYTHATSSWSLELELVMMGSVSGAEAAFRGASWDTGEVL